MKFAEFRRRYLKYLQSSGVDTDEFVTDDEIVKMFAGIFVYTEWLEKETKKEKRKLKRRE
ncbi:hypothetical protein [Peribacillus muralis]|uniref:hypothetical protein n=1 Tax=Peribacillus muralis TaxID=264697 RepID=UPI003CFC29FC